MEYGGKSKLTTNSRSTVKQKWTHSKVWTSAVAQAGEAETGAIYVIRTIEEVYGKTSFEEAKCNTNRSI